MLTWINTGHSWYKWMVLPPSIIDGLAILPFYIEVVIRLAIGKTKVLRLLRVFRVLKILKQIPLIPGVVKSSTNRKTGVSVIAFFLMFIFALSSSAKFYADLTDSQFDKQWSSNADNYTTFLQSTQTTFWWCLRKITTVGHGDGFPTLDAVKIVVWLAMLVTIAYLSSPIIKIGNAVYNEIAIEEVREQLALRKLRTEKQTIAIKLKKRVKHFNTLLSQLQSEVHSSNELILKIDEDGFGNFVLDNR